MTEKFKILAEFIKDVSSETPDVQTYLFVKENISKYHLDIDINSKALKNKLVEVNTTLRFSDKEANEKKSQFEITYVSIVKIEESVLRNAPHTMRLLVSDDWNLNYTREKAAFPLKWVKERKFFPTVRRVNDAYGDRNLICSCAPVSDYSNK